MYTNFEVSVLFLDSEGLFQLFEPKNLHFMNFYKISYHTNIKF
jgi:hypothetical protein